MSKEEKLGDYMETFKLPFSKQFGKLAKHPPLGKLALITVALVILRVAVGMFIVIPNDTGIGGFMVGIINPILVLGFLVRSLLSLSVTGFAVFLMFLGVLAIVRISQMFIKEGVALSGVLFLMIIVTAYRIFLQVIQVVFNIPVQTTPGFSIDSLALFKPENVWISKLSLDLLLNTILFAILLRYTAKLPKKLVIIWTGIFLIIFYFSGIFFEWINFLHFNFRFDGWRY